MLSVEEVGKAAVGKRVNSKVKLCKAGTTSAKKKNLVFEGIVCSW